MTNNDEIKRKLEGVLKEIETINSNVLLIGVTKGFSYDAVSAAIESGLTYFGENKIQEAVPKIIKIREKNKGIKWHFIGHLQSNKAKKAAEYFDMIQSIDSVKLASKINACADGPVDVLLELKVSDEPAKYGFGEDELSAAADEISKFDNIKIKGLMAVAPFFTKSERARPYFKRARAAFEKLKKNYNKENIEIKYLSMGMSGDYREAIEEGANMVRIGSAIFGERY